MRYPLVCFDLDGTLVDETVYIWSTLHSHFQTDSEKRTAAREAFFAERISYSEWFETDLDLLHAAGANHASMKELFSSLPVMPGARETLAALRKEGRKIAIISGSVDLVLHTLFPEEPFDHVLINRLDFDDTGQLIGGTPTPYDIDRKADGLRELARLEGIDVAKVAFVGDNTNDVAVASMAGRAIAFNCKSDALAEVAHVVIEDRDLRAILPHL